MKQETRDLPDLTDHLGAWCQVIEHAPVAMALTLGERHTLHCVSPAMAQLFDSASGDLHEQPLHVAFPTMAAMVALFDRVFTTGTAEVSPKQEYVHPKGGIVSYTCAVWRIGPDIEDPVGLVVQVQDVTSHVQTHDADEVIAMNLREINERLVLSGLREHAARAEAEAALMVRNQFLSIASHELKSPLTALTGYTYILEERLARMEADGFVKQAAAMIGRQARRLDALIDQLLDVSRIEQGQLSIDAQPLDVRMLVDRVVQSMRLTMTDHTLTLTLSEEPVPVLGDDLRLEQVVQNLVNNAVKYSPAGGSIVVQVTQSGSDAIIEVRDNGIGIPAEAQLRLFESFFRANNAHKFASGFGIGLYVVKQIVSQHQGRIDVESIEGQGSTFRVVVPLHRICD